MKNFKLMNIMIMLSIEKKNFIFETEEQKTHRRLPDRDETMSGNVQSQIIKTSMLSIHHHHFISFKNFFIFKTIEYLCVCVCNQK